MVGMAPVAAVPNMYSPLRYLTPVAREVRIVAISTMLVIFVIIFIFIIIFIFVIIFIIAIVFIMILLLLIAMIMISWSKSYLWRANTSLQHETACSPTSQKHFAIRSIWFNCDYQRLIKNLQIPESIQTQKTSSPTTRKSLVVPMFIPLFLEPSVRLRAFYASRCPSTWVTWVPLDLIKRTIPQVDRSVHRNQSACAVPENIIFAVAGFDAPQMNFVS